MVHSYIKVYEVSSSDGFGDMSKFSRANLN